MLCEVIAPPPAPQDAERAAFRAAQQPRPIRNRHTGAVLADFRLLTAVAAAVSYGRGVPAEGWPAPGIP